MKILKGMNRFNNVKDCTFDQRMKIVGVFSFHLKPPQTVQTVHLRITTDSYSHVSHRVRVEPLSFLFELFLVSFLIVLNNFILLLSSHFDHHSFHMFLCIKVPSSKLKKKNTRRKKYKRQLTAHSQENKKKSTQFFKKMIFFWDVPLFLGMMKTLTLSC